MTNDSINSDPFGPPFVSTQPLLHALAHWSTRCGFHGNVRLGFGKGRLRRAHGPSQVMNDR